MINDDAASTVSAKPAAGRQRIVVVGAGIVGLAHAWAAAKRGHQVTVLERDAKAAGASVRNFGMIWPIGQPHGELHRLALRSRDAWLNISREAGFWLQTCGSIHLAHAPDEWTVLQEFHAAAPKLGFDCQLLNADQVLSRSAGANPELLIGGLFSDSEACVNPRHVIGAIADWLRQRWGVIFQFGTPVRDVEPGRVRTAAGTLIEADKIIVCGGDDCRTLFPDVIRQHGIRRCKLQMLKTVPQPGGWRLGPHLAGGLTLRHYRNFAVCPALPALVDRIARATPELDRHGIHVMASQNDVGEVILGDSHEYDEDIEPFDKAEIDNLMLRELRRIIRLPNWDIAERWHGIYLKHLGGPVLEVNPIPGVYISTATGGAGMTMSFGLAERFWEQFDDR